MQGLQDAVSDSGRKAIIVVTHVDNDAPVTNSADDAGVASSDVCPSFSSEKQIFDTEVSIDRRLCVEPRLNDGDETIRTEVAPSSEVDNTSPASSSPTPADPSTLVQRLLVDEEKLLLKSAASSASCNYRTVTACQSSRHPEVEQLQVGQQLLPRSERRLSCRRPDDVSRLDDNTGLGETEVDRAKRRTARARERRATLVLGVVMISFVGCWLPFFFVYPVSLLTGLQVPELVFAVIFWLGYCNSALNPIIYTVFNRDFRRAFQKLLSCSSVSCNSSRL